MQKIAFLSLCVNVFAACGGGGSTGGVDVPCTTGLSCLISSADALATDFADLDYTPLTNVPQNGSFQYRGFMVTQLSAGTNGLTDQLASELEIDIGFDVPDLVGGRAFGFVDGQDRALSGTLALSGGAFDRNGNPEMDATLTFQGNGTLTYHGGDMLDLNIDFAGDFLGPTYVGISGRVEGDVTFNSEVSPIGGTFVVSR